MARREEKHAATADETASASSSSESSGGSDSMREAIRWELPTCMLAVGAPGRGKSHLIRYLIYEMFYDPEREPAERMKFGMVFCSPASMDEYDFIDEPAAKVEGYDEDRLVAYVARLVAQRKSLEAQGKKMPHNFVILDDLVGQLTSGSAAFRQFVTTHRKSNTTVILATQYLNRNIDTTVRACIKYAFLFNTKMTLSLKAFYDAFGQLFESYDEFKRVFFARANKKDHSCMLFVEGIEEAAENYFKFIAPPPSALPRYRLHFGPKPQEEGAKGKAQGMSREELQKRLAALE